MKKNFTSWTSENEEIDVFIKNMQLKIDNSNNILFEWIPYKQLSHLEEIGQGGLISAIWKEGPLHYDMQKKIKERMLFIKRYLLVVILAEKTKSSLIIALYKFMIHRLCYIFIISIM